MQRARERANKKDGFVKELVFPKKYIECQEKYFDSPSRFVIDCISWKNGRAPTDYQLEMIDKVPIEKRVGVRGPHGIGKTAPASWLVLWFALTRDGLDWKIPTTASAWRQLTHYLWPEIHKWIRQLNWDAIGREPFSKNAELLTLALKLNTGQAFAVASNDPATIEGAHADHLLYIFDESKKILDETFDASEGAFSGAGGDTDVKAYAFAISTPGEPSGRFYDIHRRKKGYEDWWTRHITLDEAIKAGRISTEWAENRKRQWGEKSSIYQNRVLGEFAAQDEDSVVPLAWIEAANLRWEEWRDAGKHGTLKAIGADPAAGGANLTVFSPLYDVNNEICDFAIDELHEFDHQDEDEKSRATMVTTGRLYGMSRDGLIKTIVDVIGIGAGIVHRLRELKANVIAFMGGEKVYADKKKKIERRDKTNQFRFKNKISFAWYNLRDLLNPDYGARLALPPHDGLTGNLTTRKYTISSDGVIEVESKEDYKKRVGSKDGSSSPDYGDAVSMVLACHNEEPETETSKSLFASGSRTQAEAMGAR